MTGTRSRAWCWGSDARSAAATPSWDSPSSPLVHLGEAAYAGGVIVDWKGAIPDNVQQMINNLNTQAQAMSPPKQCSMESF